jgi:hypothetical protein
MTKSEIIKQLAADLKESAARNRMQREGGHYVEVDSWVSTDEYLAYGAVVIEYSEGVQVGVTSEGIMFTRKTGHTEIIRSLIQNLLQ